MRYISKISFLFLSVQFLQFSDNLNAETLPKFKDYPVTKIYYGPSKLPKFSKDSDAEWITNKIQSGDLDVNEIKRGSNFAGHYFIMTTFCGGPCGLSYIVDRRTGKYVMFPLTGDNYPGIHLKYRKNSRLIIASY
jgi:hypothetical protein